MTYHRGIISNPFEENGGGGGGGGSTVNVVNNLTTNSAVDALSAAMGVELKRLIDEISVPASTTTAGLVKVDGVTITIDSNGVISATAPTIDIVDNLEDGGIDKALSAEQGKVLRELVEAHDKKIAGIGVNGELGHVKVDGTSILIDNEGTISVNLDLEGNLRKEEIVLEGFAGGETSITFTPQIVAEPFVELVYDNTTKLNPNDYTLNPNGDGSYTVEFVDPLKATDLINITLLSGLANGDEGEPLIKESFRFENLATADQQGVTIPFSPVEVTETFIDFLYVNTTKLEESEYTINQISANPLQYELVLGANVNVDENTMVNLVLVDGKGFGGGSGSNVSVVDNLITQDTTKALSANQGYVLDNKLTEHSELIASDTALGHVKVDNNTIKIDTDGVISVDLDIQGNLRKEEIVVEGLTVGANTITFTPTSVNENFIELVYYNTTKLNPNNYDLADNGDSSFTITFKNNTFKATDLVNITLIAGLADGTDGEPLKKESFRIENIVTADQNGATIEFQPTQVKDTFIDLVYVNTTKLEESEYEIVKTSDAPLTYNLILGNTVNVDPNTMVNIVLIDGLGVGGSGGGIGTVTSVNGILPINGDVTIPNADENTVGLTQLTNVIDINEVNKSVTSEAVISYVESLDSDLTKNAFNLIPTTVGQTEIDMPNIYDPNEHINIIFFNSIKLLEDRYNIEEKVTGDPTQGYKLVLVDPVVDPASTLYNLILISGKAIGGTGTGSDIELHYIVDDNNTSAVTPKAVKDYIEDLESNLAKQSFELKLTAQGQTEIDMPAVYDPTKHIEFLYFNGLNLLESTYSIEEKVVGDPTQGHKIVLANPPSDYTTAVYNLELVSGRAIASKNGSGVISVNGLTPDENGDIQIETVDKYIWKNPTTPPPSGSYIWLRE